MMLMNDEEYMRMVLAAPRLAPRGPASSVRDGVPAFALPPPASRPRLA